MASPEGLITMSEGNDLPEENRGPQVPPIDSVPEKSSIKDWLASRTAAAETWIESHKATAAGVLGFASLGITALLPGERNTAIADGSPNPTKTPVSQVRLPITYNDYGIVDTGGVPTAQFTATPTENATDEPIQTVTSEPPVTVTLTPGATDTPPPSPTIETPTATPTEKGPLKELLLADNMLIGIPAGSSLQSADTLRNGNVRTGAKAVGLKFDQLKNPYREPSGKYVIGTIVYPSDDPYTISIESEHDRVALVPSDTVDPEMLKNVRPFDPEKDKEYSYKHSLWAGKDGKEFTFQGTDLNNGSGMINGAIAADFTEQSTNIHLDAYSTGQRGKAARIVLGSPGDESRSLNRVVIEVVAGTGVTNIRDLQQNYFATSNTLESIIKTPFEKIQNGADKSEPKATDWGKVVYTFQPGQPIDFKLNHSSITVDKVDYPIAYGLRGPVFGVNLWGDGGRQENATLHIKKLGMDFEKAAFGDLSEKTENTLPSLAELGTQAGITILAPVLTEGLESQPGMDSLFRKTGQILNLNNPFKDNVGAEKYYEDQGVAVAKVIRVYDSDEEIIENIKDRPGGMVQLAPYPTSDGFAGGWFDNNGKLIVPTSKIFAAIKAAKDNNATVILDTRVAIDTSEFQTKGKEPTKIQNIRSFVDDLNRSIPNAPVIIAFEGDQAIYDELDIEINTDRMIAELRDIRDKGVGVGLMHIQSSDSNQTGWFQTIAEVGVKANTELIGFETRAFNPTSKGPMGIFERDSTSVGQEPLDKYKPRKYSPGYKAFRDRLVEDLNDKIQ